MEPTTRASCLSGHYRILPGPHARCPVSAAYYPPPLSTNNIWVEPTTRASCLPGPHAACFISAVYYCTHPPSPTLSTNNIWVEPTTPASCLSGHYSILPGPLARCPISAVYYPHPPPPPPPPPPLVTHKGQEWARKNQVSHHWSSALHRTAHRRAPCQQQTTSLHNIPPEPISTLRFSNIVTSADQSADPLPPNDRNWRTLVLNANGLAGIEKCANFANLVEYAKPDTIIISETHLHNEVHNHWATICPCWRTETSEDVEYSSQLRTVTPSLHWTCLKWCWDHLGWSPSLWEQTTLSGGLLPHT